MNRELRRMSQKGEERAKKRRQEQGRAPRRKERVGMRQYFREVRQELKKVAWPSREQTTTFTVAVLISTGFITAVIFGLDFVFKWGVLRVLRQV